MAQEHIHSTGGSDDDGDFGSETQQGGQVHIDKQGTDDLLDEIDGLLGNNAEDFVSSYVQKGGQ